MDQYQALIHDVQNQKVKFYFILSVERSYSTTLQLALAQSPEIHRQINLPFNNYSGLELTDDNIPITTVLQRIHNVVTPLMNSDNKIRVLIHEHFDCLPCDNHLKLLLQLSTNFVCCVRNPKIQFLSCILVSMNDLFLHENSIRDNNLFSYQNLILLLKTFKYDISNFDGVMYDIINKQKIVTRDLSTIYQLLKPNNNHIYSISLQDIFREFLNVCQKDLEFSWAQASYILQHLKDIPGNSANVIVIDGESFVQHPTKTLKYITEQFSDISFSHDMINNWHKFTGKDFICCISKNLPLASNNVWNGESQHSTGIKFKEKTHNHILDAELLDEKFQLVLQNALKIYTQFNDMIRLRS